MLSKKYKDFLDLVFYQIYPKSFKDSNGDGMGDLKGITEKIPYLKELGVTAVWLSPCYKTNNDDGGYDIYDYRDIQEDFGTLEDWKEMIRVMHENGIKLIMDYVANHTSTSHKWFQEGRKSKDNPYHDFYIWCDKPMNDWHSCFGGSVWEYNEPTNEYYLHSFCVSQADLNWDNPAVRREMIDIIDFWVDLGVDGFRCDVLDMISKELPYKNGHGPNLHKYINMIFGREKTKHLFTVGECYSEDPQFMIDVSAYDRKELSTTFQFDIINVGRRWRFDPVPLDYGRFREIYSKWQKVAIDNDLLYPTFMENHDQPRCVTLFGDDKNYRYESATMLATLVYSLRGVPFIYQGQEIGVTNSSFDDIKYFDDVETVGFYKENKDKYSHEEIMRRINFGSRDNARHPMPWNGGENGGFGTGKPWLSLYPYYKDINVEDEMKRDKSVYRYFKEYFAMRKNNDILKYGDYEDITKDGQCAYYAYKRTYEGKSLVIICNYNNETTVDIDMSKLKKIFGNYNDDNGANMRKFECGIYEVID